MSRSKWKRFDMELQDYLEDEDVIDLHALKDKDWADIKKLCIQVYDSQQGKQKDMFKATVAGFCVWLMHSEKSIAIGADESTELH
jgi:hypothetical protein